MRTSTSPATSIRCWQSERSVTSVTTVRHSTPRARQATATSSSSSARRAPRTRFAPRRASSSAVARPIPLDAPVTTTVLFFSAEVMNRALISRATLRADVPAPPPPGSSPHTSLPSRIGPPETVRAPRRATRQRGEQAGADQRAERQRRRLRLHLHALRGDVSDDDGDYAEVDEEDPETVAGALRVDQRRPDPRHARGAAR